MTNRNAFYCPQNTMYQWDFAPWTLLGGGPHGIPWLSVGSGPGIGSTPGFYFRDMGYFYLASRPDDRNPQQIHPDAPISFSDPGSLPLFADRNENKGGFASRDGSREHGPWVMVNHPGFYEYTPTGYTAPDDLEPDGTNVALLDGSVEWRTFGDMDPTRYGYLCGPCWSSSW